LETLNPAHRLFVLCPVALLLLTGCRGALVDSGSEGEPSLTIQLAAPSETETVGFGSPVSVVGTIEASDPIRSAHISVNITAIDSDGETYPLRLLLLKLDPRSDLQISFATTITLFEPSVRFGRERVFFEFAGDIDYPNGPRTFSRVLVRSLK
jgi:hypothetical protein